MQLRWQCPSCLEVFDVEAGCEPVICDECAGKVNKPTPKPPRSAGHRPRSVGRIVSPAGSPGAEFSTVDQAASITQTAAVLGVIFSGLGLLTAVAWGIHCAATEAWFGLISAGYLSVGSIGALLNSIFLYAAGGAIRVLVAIHRKL